MNPTLQTVRTSFSAKHYPNLPEYVLMIIFSKLDFGSLYFLMMRAVMGNALCRNTNNAYAKLIRYICGARFMQRSLRINNYFGPLEVTLFRLNLALKHLSPSVEEIQLHMKTESHLAYPSHDLIIDLRYMSELKSLLMAQVNPDYFCFNTTKLVNLSILFTQNYDGYYDFQQFSRCPLLEYLNIDHELPDYNGQIISPRLRTLVLQEYDEDNELCYLSLVQAHRKSLERIIFTRPRSDVVEFLNSETITFFPNLTEIVLDSEYTDLRPLRRNKFPLLYKVSLILNGFYKCDDENDCDNFIECLQTFADARIFYIHALKVSPPRNPQLMLQLVEKAKQIYDINLTIDSTRIHDYFKFDAHHYE